MCIGEQSQAAEGLRDGRSTCSFKDLDAAADRNERPDARFGGGKVNEKIVMNGVRQAGEGGFAGAARHFQIAGKIFVSKLSAEKFVHIAAHVGAGRHSILDTDFARAEL